MSEESARQHELEFGGSEVKEDFDGTISFDLRDAIPVLTIAYRFDDTTARQFRYLMGATLGPQEYHFHQRYQYLIVDLRAVTAWRGEAPAFMGTVRDALRRMGGDLFLVTYDASMLPGEFHVYETVDEALEAVKATRQRAAAR
jgi:hypothetical protein